MTGEKSGRGKYKEGGAKWRQSQLTNQDTAGNAKNGYIENYLYILFGGHYGYQN